MLEILFTEDTPRFTISERSQQILRDQEIDEDGPGTILRDFETLLHFVGNDGLKTTSKYYLLPQRKLDELNLQMSHPVTHRLKRPQQRSFPHLHGLYLLLRASGMGMGAGAPPSGRLMLDQEAVMELFGWVRLEFDEPAAGEGVRVSAIERLDLGDAMVNTFHTAYLEQRWPTYYDEAPAEPGVLRPLFQPYFPEYEQVPAQQDLPYRDGTFVWRVSLGKAWRRIAASDDATLDNLAMTILDAFDFDMDHLYCFDLHQPNGRKLRIACPHENDAAAFTDEFACGELLLAEGGTMTMTFDYGTPWHFNVKLEEIRTSAETERPHVIAKRGKSPAQYDWEDEEAWD